jgi:hypothetical protein
MTDNEKIHQILEFIHRDEFENKDCFETNELKSAFDPPISISEANLLCKKLIDEGVVLDATTKDNKGTVSIVKTPNTFDHYTNREFLKREQEELSLSSINIIGHTPKFSQSQN